jgi:hypothetical protein
MTFSRLARTKQYARGNERPSSFMTSAMQIVADRETPTRQWTSVAPPSLFPASTTHQYASLVVSKETYL